MAGYWQHQAETDKVIDKNGWFATGDIGVMDEKGFVRIVDRKKDMILVSGFNVYPNEIEGVVAAHPGVLECAAVGVPDKKSGEAVKLYVVKKDPALTSDDVLKYCREHLTNYKVPARRRVPHRPAQVERRQDPASRTARRGEEEGGVIGLTASNRRIHDDAPRQGTRAAGRADAARHEPARRHLRRLDHVAGRHRRRRCCGASRARPGGDGGGQFLHVQAAGAGRRSRDVLRGDRRASERRRLRSTSRYLRSATRKIRLR